MMIGSLRTLIQSCPDALLIPDSKGHLPLHVAAKNESASLEVIRELLQPATSVASEIDKKGFLPLHLVARRKVPSPAIIEELLEAFQEAASIEMHIERSEDQGVRTIQRNRLRQQWRPGQTRVLHLSQSHGGIAQPQAVE